MRYPFYTADVFTDRVFGGNPLAVFPHAEGLDAPRMQLIAREFNLSETAFVLPPDDPAHTRRVRIFTPTAELPFAGHPTIGTAVVLAAIGAIPLGGAWTEAVFEEGAGPVPVAIRAGADGRPAFARLTAARLPEFGPPPPAPDRIAEALSLDTADLATDGGDAPRAVSCGVPFLFVRVRDRAALARARPDRAAWDRVLAPFWAPQVYVLAFDPERPGSDLRARMFAPSLGVDEDPATGAAAAALAGYLGARDGRGERTLRWVVEQGFEMGRPSILEVEADRGPDGAIAAVRVGGAAVLVSQGEMTVPATA